MRALLSILLATTALPSWAETIPATSRITAVTVYPDGAKLTREITFAAPSAGQHELLVTDLPAETDPGMMQLAPGAGLQLGAFNLRADRLPPREDPLTADQQAAKAKVEELSLAAEQAYLALEAVNARIEAAEAQVRFLSSFTGSLPEGATPEAIRDMAAMIGAETLAARQASLVARGEVWPAQQVLEDAQQALVQAQAAYDSLPSADMDFTALSVAVTAEAAGDHTVTVTQYVYGAGWRPFYDLKLTREGDDVLTMDRSILVTQYTGEDWSDVALTLSSSRPADQAAPSSLWPELRWIEPEASDEDYARKSAAEADGALYMEEEVVAEAAPITAVAGLEGDTVVYDYPTTVTIASGVEDLRLSLDSLTFAPVVKAVAVPRYDRTAFVVASFTNGSDEPLLPGDVLLYREGVLVGSSYIDVIAPGVETDLAFGAIDTLRISREMPLREGGETGVFTSANELTESVVITVENTGDESWPLQVIDQVPYSEQTDLEIDYSASPEPTEIDLDGQRGVLAWDFDLAAGGKETVTLDHTISWPEGMLLR